MSALLFRKTIDFGYSFAPKEAELYASITLDLITKDEAMRELPIKYCDDYLEAAKSGKLVVFFDFARRPVVALAWARLTEETLIDLWRSGRTLHFSEYFEEGPCGVVLQPIGDPKFKADAYLYMIRGLKKRFGMVRIHRKTGSRIVNLRRRTVSGDANASRNACIV